MPSRNHSKIRDRTLLDALDDPMADPSHIGLISSNALAVYTCRI
jgi:hypothetical protein